MGINGSCVNFCIMSLSKFSECTAQIIFNCRAFLAEEEMKKNKHVSGCFFVLMQGSVLCRFAYVLNGGRPCYFQLR